MFMWYFHTCSSCKKCRKFRRQFPDAPVKYVERFVPICFIVDRKKTNRKHVLTDKKVDKVGAEMGHIQTEVVGPSCAAHYGVSLVRTKCNRTGALLSAVVSQRCD